MDEYIISAYHGIRKAIIHYHGNAFNVKRSEDKSVDTIVFELRHDPDFLTVTLETESDTLRPIMRIHRYSSIGVYDVKKKVYLDALSFQEAFIQSIDAFIDEYRCGAHTRRNKNWLRDNKKLLKTGQKGASSLGYNNLADFIITMSRLADKQLVEILVGCNDATSNPPCVWVRIITNDLLWRSLYFSSKKEMQFVMSHFDGIQESFSTLDTQVIRFIFRH